MRKLLFVIFFLTQYISYAQVYKITSEATKENGIWSEWRVYECFVSLFGESNDKIIIFGIPEKTYYLIESLDLYRDKDMGTVFKYHSVDNEGKKCIVILTLQGDHPNIKKHLYIKYSNITYAYYMESP